MQMRYVVFVKLTGQAAKDYESGRMPTQDEIAAMMAYNEELAKAGVMVGGDGLHPTAKAVRVEASGTGKPKVTDGPFAESKELIGGFWLWKVNSKEEAVEWASRCPLSEGDVLELRQIFDMEDFGDAIGPDEAAAWERVESLIVQS
jgi:hypothetical protein